MRTCASTRAFAITQSKSPRIAQELIRLGNTDKEGDVRAQAWFWLAHTGAAESEAAIIAALKKDNDEHVREQAIFALSQLPEERATRALIAVAEDRVVVERAAQARHVLVGAVGIGRGAGVSGEGVGGEGHRLNVRRSIRFQGARILSSEIATCVRSSGGGLRKSDYSREPLRRTAAFAGRFKLRSRSHAITVETLLKRNFAAVAARSPTRTSIRRAR